ncbi:hypothetical protein EPN42_05020, partial [bacterium]
MRILAIAFFLLLPAMGVASAQPMPSPSPAPSGSPAPEAFRVSADRLAYYSDRYVIVGTGHVRVDYGSAVITGERFSMDLRLNRFLVAGGVHLQAPSGAYDGAAFAEYIDFRRSYFIPVSPEPDRWTFLDGSYGSHNPGREMPGDTFFLPNAEGSTLFLTARTAEIRPRSSVTFRPATLLAAGNRTLLPTPSYVLNFAANPYFGQNSLSGAQFDGPYFFLGGPNQLGALHVRYNGQDRAYLSFEERLVEGHDGQRGYLVFSGNPLTRPDKQFNLIEYHKFSDRTSGQLVTQLFTDQSGLSQPLSSSGFATYQLVHSLRESFVALTGTQSEGNLLAPNPLGYYGDPSHGIVSNHPFKGSLSWTGFAHNLDKHFNTFFRLRSGLDYNHDTYGVLQGHYGDVYPTLWDRYVGATLYTKSFDVGRGVKVNASLDRQITSYSYPHLNTATSTTLTASKFFTTHEAVVAQVQFADSVDQWPPFSTSGALQRSYILSNYFTPSPEFSLQLSYQHDNDTPAVLPFQIGQPVPFGVSQLSPRAPNQLLADLRVRLTHSL